MKELKFKITGVTPLMMSSDRSANPLDESSIQLKKLTSIRKKTDEINREIVKSKWMAAMYWDSKLGVYMPVINIWRSIHEAAKITREGKSIERGLHAPPVRGFSIIYDGAKNPEKLYEDKQFVDVRLAKPPGQGKVLAARPIFPEWAIEGSFLYDSEMLNDDSLKDFFQKAGKYCGLGTYRRFFGRYDVEF